MDPLSARVTARWRWLNGLAIDMLTFSTSSGTSSFNSASLPGSDPAIQNVGLQEYPMFQTASNWIAGSSPAMTSARRLKYQCKRFNTIQNSRIVFLLYCPFQTACSFNSGRLKSLRYNLSSNRAEPVEAVLRSASGFAEFSCLYIHSSLLLLSNPPSLSGLTRQSNPRPSETLAIPVIRRSRLSGRSPGSTADLRSYNDVREVAEPVEAALSVGKLASFKSTACILAAV